MEASESIGSVSEIRGVGKKTVKRLEKEFGTEEEVLERVKQGDVASLCRAPGVGEWKAAEIIKNAIAEEYGCESLLKTDTIKEIYNEIQSELRKRACTEYGEAKLRIFFPTNSRERIKEVRRWCRKCLELEIDEEVNDLLKGVNPLAEASCNRLSDRVIITGDTEIYTEAKEAFPELMVKLIDSPEELKNINQNGKRLIQIDDSLHFLGSVDYIPNGLEKPEKIVPERVLSFYRSNLQSIKNSIKIHRDVEEIQAIGNEEIEELEKTLSQLGEDGDIEDEELERIENALNLIDSLIEEMESELREEIEEMAEERELKISGKDLVEVLRSRDRVDTILKRGFGEEFEEKIRNKTEKMISKLDLRDEEEEIAYKIFEDKIDLPFRADEKAVEDLKSRLNEKYRERSLEVKTKLASSLSELKDPTQTLVAKVLELDVALALKRFAQDHEMSLPRFRENGFEFKKGKNISIEDVEPIDYKVEGVTLLTGVNSGGKTSTLDLISQIFILSHMGFPVPAQEAEIEKVDEIYYYTTGKRTVGTGSFENILKRFEGLISSDKNKLILIDELENITEPGASAKIVAGIAELLEEDGETAVIVSHLAEKINEVAELKVPVDGIEAEGLDEDMNLIVERTPQKGLFAASTPELLVKKLHTQRNSRLYDRLINKF